MKLGFRSAKGCIREEKLKDKDRPIRMEIHLHVVNGRRDYRREK
jgi:hypothetical protein